MNSNVIEVSAGVITRNNKILLAKRTDDYLNDLWEFPGGKIEKKETPSLAIIREIMEELSLTVEAHDTLLVLNHKYPDKEVRLHFINCSIINSEYNEIKDLGELDKISNVKWFTPATFPFGNFCPADEIAAKKIKWNKLINNEEA